MTTYKEINGTSYHQETSDRICTALEDARLKGLRVRLFYGDVKTGKAWDEEHDVTGKISRSMGRIKVPILIHNDRSNSGGALLDHCIVRLQTTDGKVLYSHPGFHTSTFTVKAIEPFTAHGITYNFAVLSDGKVYANCEQKTYAQNLADFMRGKRGRI